MTDGALGTTWTRPGRTLSHWLEGGRHLEFGQSDLTRTWHLAGPRKPALTTDSDRVSLRRPKLCARDPHHARRHMFTDSLSV